MDHSKIRQRIAFNRQSSSPNHNQSASTWQSDKRKFKRSCSRQSSLKTSRSHSKDSESESISKFFVKNLQKDPPQPRLIDKVFKKQSQTKDRHKVLSPSQKIQSTNNNQKPKKRTPTPAKTIKKDNNENLRHSGANQVNNQSVFLEIKVLELEKKLKSQKREKINIQKANREHENINSKLNLQNTRLIKDVQRLKSEKNECLQKIRQLQSVAEKNRVTMCQAKSNMQKIKQSIKDNRLLQIKQQIKVMQRQVQSLTQQKNKMQIRIQELQLMNSQQAQQIMHLKKQFYKDSISKRQSLKQQCLTKQIEELKSRLGQQKGEKQIVIEVQLSKTRADLYEALKQISILNMKRDLDEIKKQKQIQMKCQQKDDVIVNWRKKYRVLLQKYKQQFEKINGNSTVHQYQKSLSQSQKVVPARCNRFSDNQLTVQLELSPQDK